MIRNRMALRATMLLPNRLAKQIIWLLLLCQAPHLNALRKLKVDCQAALLLDSNSTKDLIEDVKVKQPSTHIAIHYLAIQDACFKGNFKLTWAPATENLVDLCTKALPLSTIQKLTAMSYTRVERLGEQLEFHLCMLQGIILSTSTFYLTPGRLKMRKLSSKTYTKGLETQTRI
jgi:hypothetical protein